ncbi:TPA: TIGR04219 family outer membrane beta-barrel protein [Photobacterium damselae]|nr:TIGR04219 family outer membrane beta-barrel protein [Photobacterium damselae]
MKKLALSAAVLAAMFAAIPAQADTLLGVKVGADAWFADSKVAGHTDDSTSGSYYVSLEHFIPLVPNVEIRYNNIDANNAKFDQTDFTAYYEILDNDLVALDLGLTMTNFSSVNIGPDHFDKWQPSLYGNAEIGIPMTPLAVFTKLNYGNIDSTKTFDGQAGVKFTLPLVVADLNLRGGYRMMDYDFDKARNDVKLDGWFLGAEVDF